MSRRKEREGGVPARGRGNERGHHPFRRLLGRATDVVKIVVVALLFFVISATLFSMITGAIGFDAGDDGFTAWVGLVLLLNVAFVWLYGKHLRWKSPHWPT